MDEVYVVVYDTDIIDINVEQRANWIKQLYPNIHINTKDELEIKNIQEKIVSSPKYDSTSRVKRKITEEFLNALQKILDEEAQKEKILGTNKQALTRLQIHELLQKQGFNVSYSSVANEISKIKNSGKECFIRQEYNFGDRLEYDFGEVKLIHVKFFKMIGGVYKEVVYDNMRNVVTKFIGKNEKELNEDLVKMSLYSVPEYLIGQRVTSKIYYNKILIYSNYELVCEHKKIDGIKKISADIRHYLKTLSQKPGALKTHTY